MMLIIKPNGIIIILPLLEITVLIVLVCSLMRFFALLLIHASSIRWAKSRALNPWIRILKDTIHKCIK